MYFAGKLNTQIVVNTLQRWREEGSNHSQYEKRSTVKILRKKEGRGNVCMRKRLEQFFCSI